MKEIKTKRYITANANIGDIDISVNWREFTRWFETGGEILSGGLRNRTDPSIISIKFKYFYDYDENEARNIIPVSVYDDLTKQNIKDSNIMEALVERYNEEIRADIEIAEEDEKMNRRPDYNPFA